MIGNVQNVLVIIVFVFCVESRVFARVIDNNNTELFIFNDDYEDQVIKFMKRVEYHGYTAEEHKLKSNDGYHLLLHRISGGPYNPPSPGKRVVYVQHGLLMSTDQFVVNGPGRDFVYLLVDAGYDVWLGNTRGNCYSRAHDYLLPENKTFWNFSFHETAVDDVKVFVDYVLEYTKQKRFTYIGFSLGTAIGYAFFSYLPEYNDKVDLIVSLGTVALWHHNNDIRVVLFRNIMKYVEKMNNFLNIHEYLPQPQFLNHLTVNVCESRNWFKRQICKLLFRIMIPKMDFQRMPTGSLKTMLKSYPSGTSAKNLFHLAQNLRSGDFTEYDYGKSNKRLYGSDKPAKYPLYKIKAPVAIYYGMNDFFGNIDDLRTLRRMLPNCIVFQKIDDEQFSHFDVVLSGNAKEVLFDTFIKLITIIHS